MNTAMRVDLMDLLGLTQEDPLWEACLKALISHMVQFRCANGIVCMP
jgi:hypothetical protein